MTQLPPDTARRLALGEMLGFDSSSIPQLVQDSQLPADETALIEGWVGTNQLGLLLAWQQLFNLGFEETLKKSLARARLGGLDLLDTVRDLLGVAGRYGADGLAGSLLDTNYRELINKEFQGSESKAAGTTALSPVYPYLEYVTKRDNRVRINHRALDRFIAASGWSGWPTVQPPNGWNCRCRLVPVNFQDAQSRGLEGETPNGTRKVSAFIFRGGPDDGFPKRDFI